MHETKAAVVNIGVGCLLRVQSRREVPRGPDGRRPPAASAPPHRPGLALGHDPGLGVPALGLRAPQRRPVLSLKHHYGAVAATPGVRRRPLGRPGADAGKRWLGRARGLLVSGQHLDGHLRVGQPYPRARPPFAELI